MIDLNKLAVAVRARRGSSSLEEAAADIAKKFGPIHASTLSLIENEKTVPALDTFAKVCAWMGLPMDYFYRQAGREGRQVGRSAA